MKTRTWCVAVALLSIGAPALAQTVLSEADALARLSADSPRVKSIRAAIELRRADVLAAGRWPNPRLTFNREAVAGVRENIFTVSQVLPITGRRGLEVSAASSLIEAERSRAGEEVRRARAELRLAYADLVSAQVREAALAQARDRVRDLAGVLAKREAAGDAAGYDRLRAEREVTELDSEWAMARADRARAQAMLGAFFAEGTDATSLVAVPTPASRAALPSVDELLRHAQTVRGEPLALQHEIDAARFTEQAAGRRLIPEPELVAGTKSSNAAGGDIGSVVSVHASIPLFDRAQPEKAMAQARVTQAEANAALFRATLTAEVSALRALVVETREAADRYRGTAANVSQLERIAQVSYDNGERGILELLDAYRTGAAARTRQMMLDASARRAEVELEFVSGWEMP